MVKIRLGRGFQQNYVTLTKNNPALRDLVLLRVKQFQQNPNDSRLRNHSLSKRLTGKYAFSITSDIRIVYETTGNNTVRFLAIGTHKQVYR